MHAASSGEGYFCRTTNEIDELLIAQTWPELEVHIFRRVQFSLRGIFDEALLADASKEIPDGEYFHIVSLDDYYPSECVWRGGGDSHAKLRQYFSELVGQRVGIGYDPFDRDYALTYTTPDEVMVLNLTRKHGHDGR